MCKSQEPRAARYNRRVTMASIFQKVLSRPAYFFKSSKGFGAIESAILMPLFLAILFSIIDYGTMMTTRIVAGYSLGVVAKGLQDDPTQSIDNLANSVQSSFVDFLKPDNCICSQVFTGPNASQNAKIFAAIRNCTWCPKISNSPITPYFLAVRGLVKYDYVTPMNEIFSLITGEQDNTNSKMIGFGQVSRVGLTPTSCANGEVLAGTGSSVTCKTPQVSFTHFTSPESCNMPSWVTVPNSNTLPTFCSLSAVDNDVPTVVSEYQCRVRRNNFGGWEYVFPVPCANINCQVSCFSAAITFP